MQLNSIIFPAPIASYSHKINAQLLWIPKPQPSQLPQIRIQNKSIYKSSNLIKKLNFTMPLEYNNNGSSPHNESTKVDNVTNSSSSIPNVVGKTENAPKKIKDFGSHNYLFSLKPMSPTSIVNKTETSSQRRGIFSSPMREKSRDNCQKTIPCLFYEYPGGSNLLLVHFHANAEDIGDSYDYMKIVAYFLKLNCILVEYPGYGLYKGKCSSETILKDSEIIIEYLINEIKIPSQNILLLGRSVGTGPATHIASKYDVGGLILVAGYTSLKKLVGDHFGKLAKWMIAERFENITKIETVKCPTLFIHGEMDELISYQHSIELKKRLKEDVYSELYLSKLMTHNKLDLYTDLIKPILKFMITSNIWQVKQKTDQKIDFPSSLKITPDKHVFRKGKTFINTFFLKNSKNRKKNL